MKTYFALLRGINVGGNNLVGMERLRQFAAELGMTEARTLLQSGNLVFRAGSGTAAELENLFELEARKSLRLEIKFFVRTEEQWRGIVAHNPFQEEARSDPAHLVAFFLKTPLAAGKVEALQAAVKDREVVRAKGSQAYIVFPDGMGRSRLTTTLIEKHLGPATGRNWNTVLKMAALVSA